MGNYDDIINLPVPATITQMTMSERAAQFSAFAALSGFEDSISSVEEKLYEAEKAIAEIDLYDCI